MRIVRYGKGPLRRAGKRKVAASETCAQHRIVADSASILGAERDCLLLEGQCGQCWRWVVGEVALRGLPWVIDDEHEHEEEEEEEDCEICFC